MTAEQIEYYLNGDRRDASRSSMVFFRKRNPLEGIFIQAPDYMELKKKNFWRFVASSRLEAYRQSKDLNLSRIFNGDEFTKLSASAERKPVQP